MLDFKLWIENESSFAIRYVHKDGNGLMNNNSLNYDKLDDEEYEEVQDGYLALQQPPSDLWGKKIIFAFTNHGIQKHHQLINLLKKASKKGVIEQMLKLDDYEVIWDSRDGQLGLIPKNPNMIS